MPGDYNNGDMKHRNGAIVQHSKRKSEYRPAGNYHSGSKMSRNQSTGAQGAENAKPSAGTSTQNMSKIDKLRYFNTLNLLSPIQKQELDSLEKAEQEPVQNPEPQPEQSKSEQPKANPVNELVQKLQQTFGSKPELFQSIVQAFKAVPKDDLKDKAHSVLNIVKSSQGQSPAELYTEVMQELEGSHEVSHTPDVSSEDDDIQFDDREEELGQVDDNKQWDDLVNFFSANSPAGKEQHVSAAQGQKMMDKVENRLGGDNLDKMRLAKSALDKAMADYVPGEQSRYMTGMNAVFNAFKKYEQEHGEKVTPDGYLKGNSNDGSTEQNDDYEQDEEESRDLARKWGSMSERDFRKDFAFLGNRFLDSIIKQAKMFKHYESALSAIANGIHNVDDTNNDDEIMRSMASTADDLSAMGFDVKPQNESINEHIQYWINDSKLKGRSNKEINEGILKIKNQ